MKLFLSIFLPLEAYRVSSYDPCTLHGFRSNKLGGRNHRGDKSTANDKHQRHLKSQELTLSVLHRPAKQQRQLSRCRHSLHP